MTGISALGVGSGLNLGSLLDKLAAAEKQRLQPLKRLEASYETKLSAYGKLQDALGQLKSAAKALGESSLYQRVTVATDSNALSATASDKAVPGHYQVRVTQLARTNAGDRRR